MNIHCDRRDNSRATNHHENKKIKKSLNFPNGQFKIDDINKFTKEKLTVLKHGKANPCISFVLSSHTIETSELHIFEANSRL